MKGLSLSLSLFHCKWILIHILCISRTFSITTHQMRNNAAQASNVVHRTLTDTDRYMQARNIAAHSSVTVLDNIRRYENSLQKRRRTKRNACDDESLNSALTSCQNSVTLTNAHLSDPDVNQTALLRTQFCGIGCRTKMFLHAHQCGISSFIVEVAGDCSNKRDTSCIHAAVIMLEGILWCSIELDHGHLNDSLEEGAPTDVPQSSESKPNTSSHQCSLSTYFSTTVNHIILYDKQGRQVLSPPLEPPWQNCSAFGFSNMSLASTTDSIVSSSSTPQSSSSSEEGQAVTSDGSVNPSLLSTTTTNGSRHCCLTYSLFFVSIMCSLALSKVFL